MAEPQAGAKAAWSDGDGGEAPTVALRAGLRPATPPPLSLLRRLLGLLERSLEARHDRREDSLALAPYKTKGYLRRRFPNEIEAVMATIDQKSLDMIQQMFGTKALDLNQFAEAIVHTGTYDAERVLAFVGGVVDLFYEVLWSQADRKDDGAPAATVNWGQLMNHLIECPEIAMFEGSGVTNAGPKSKGTDDVLPQVRRNNFMDRAKHQGQTIEKIIWIAYLDLMVTTEGTDAAYMWSPHHPSWDAPKTFTPELPPNCFDDHGKPLYTVLSAAWSEDDQELLMLLSNRMLISWRLRNREKAQLQQRRAFRFDARRGEARSSAEKDHWKIFVVMIDPKTGEDFNKRRSEDRGEAHMRREKCEERLAAEEATQLDIWYNSNMRQWVTTDRRGRLFFWDLLKTEGTWLEAHLKPTAVLTSHTKLVTSHLEMRGSKFKFTTCSLDRSVILWDNRTLAPEVKIDQHTGSVLSQAYLPRFSFLVTVGCEKRVFVWSIDSTAFRGMRAKLSAHQANLMQVSAGERVFFTLDEAFVLILWDGATLVNLQTCACAALAPKHALCLPQLGRICLAGRRLNFYEGNEVAAIYIGRPPTKEQEAKAKSKQEEGASLKDRAMPKWCGLAPARGAVLSATSAEVRLHVRSCPADSRPIYNAPDGDKIAAFATAEKLSFIVVGTQRGSIQFLKYRSGFTLKEYRGKSEKTDKEAGSGEAAKQAQQRKGAAAIKDGAATTAGAEAGRSASPGGGSRSPVSPTAKGSAVASPHGGGGAGAMTPAAGASAVASGDGAAPEDDAGAHGEGDQSATAPSAEEIARGLSKNITYVLPCEEQRRIYVGTGEGTVLIFTCDPGFPVQRWLKHPDDISPVTIMHCKPEVKVEDEFGLLAVGTQDGVVHLYSRASLILAGSINIPRTLPDGGDTLSPMAPLRHLRLFSVPAEPQLPLTLMTVDHGSRMRLWGLQIHPYSGKLKELKLLLDGGQLREFDSMPVAMRKTPGTATAGAGKDGKAGKAAKSGKDAKARKAPKEEGTSGDAPGEAEAENGEQGGKGKVEEVTITEMERLESCRGSSGETVRITVVATLPGLIALPKRPLQKQHQDGPTPAAAAKELTVVMANRLGAEANGRKPEIVQPEKGKEAAKGSSAFLTALPNTDLFEEPEDMKPFVELSGSESDGDADEVVGRRLNERPRTPPPPPPPPPSGMPPGDGSEGAVASVDVEADGDSFVFIADSTGWIWCIDVADTVVQAINACPPPAVLLDITAARNAANAARPAGLRGSMRPGHAPSTSFQGVPPAVKIEEPGVLMTKTTPKQRPEVIKVVGAWPAHQAHIMSLVPTNSPPALVSTDTSKEVKIWSTSGDLWGHFSLRSVNSAPAVAQWPPPHVLAVQLQLMRKAKEMCRKMNLVTGSKGGKSGGEQMTKMRRSHSQKTVKGRRISIGDKEKAALAAKGASSAATLPRPQEAAPAAAAITDALSATGTSKGNEAAPDVAKDAAAAAVAVSTAAATAGGADSATADGAAPAAAATAEGDAVGEDAEARPDSPQHGSDAGGGQADQAPGGGETAAKGKAAKAFTSGQMKEMIRSRAFSSGYQSYGQFVRKAGARTETNWRRGESSAQLDKERSSFFGRPPSAFGVELMSQRDTESWEQGVRTLGPRSASEGALLRYAQSAAEDMARSVRETLGVDVSSVSRRQMRKPSFASRLDIGRVSLDPTNEDSATAKAVKKLYESQQKTVLPLLTLKK